MTDNLAIWDRLARTDPKHTKPFNRSGGFRGTAVKPIYTEQKMTETFGACGVGWGISEPNYQLVNGSDGEVVVYCWLTIWYLDPATGARSEPVPGIGGDFAIKINKNGKFADDEAFKKAATDAVGNAMKHLGMSADVHMGQHDDDKYVTALRREIEAEEREHQASSPPPPPAAPQMTEAEAEWREWARARADGYREAPTLEDLDFAISLNVVDMNKCGKEAPRVHKKLLATIAQIRMQIAQAPVKAA